MDTQFLAIWIGLFITFLLGLINLLWGPAILKSREKVIIAIDGVFADYSPKENNLELNICCSLVLTCGDKELQVVDVSVLFDRKAYKNLRQFFNLPHRERLALYPDNTSEENESRLRRTPSTLLEPKKLVNFSRKIFFEKSSNSKVELPDIQPYLDQLESKYNICWRRYDLKKVCWRFPNRWWRNLGKKLWG